MFGRAVEQITAQCFKLPRVQLRRVALLENNFNHHTLIRQRKVNRFHRPRRFQSKKMFVKGGVFHDGIGVFEKLDSPTLKKKSQCN